MILSYLSILNLHNSFVTLNNPKLECLFIISI
jgi:hypothetical protein